MTEYKCSTCGYATFIKACPNCGTSLTMVAISQLSA